MLLKELCVLDKSLPLHTISESKVEGFSAHDKEGEQQQDNTFPLYYTKYLFNRPCVAGAVLQSASWFIDSLIQSVIQPFPPNLQNIINPKPEELGRWHFERRFTPHNTVMSTNIRIFEYSNKMAHEYYSYLYFCHFPSTNIFGYPFVDFWTTEYIQIFGRKFLKIQIYFNICKSLILIFVYIFLM